MCKDPYILLSIINTKLRDLYDSLDKLCDVEDMDKNEVMTILNGICYFYDESLNQFKIK